MNIILYFVGRIYNNECAHDRLPPSAQKKGSWVVERVVGSGELRAPDDSLREQLKRLQITRKV